MENRQSSPIRNAARGALSSSAGLRQGYGQVSPKLEERRRAARAEGESRSEKSCRFPPAFATATARPRRSSKSEGGQRAQASEGLAERNEARCNRWWGPATLKGALFLGLMFASGLVWGDQLVLDKAVRAGGLWCVPSAEDPLRFRYLPEDARLARDEDGRPLFSIIYYVEPQPSSGGATTTQQGNGGALLTMIVEYRTSRGKQARAQAALQRLVDADAVLDGPVVFDAGSYALTSSIGTEAMVAFSAGSAPVLEGGQVALSLQFGAASARRLSAALEAHTPDLSVVFDMTYSGVRSSYDAEILIDWDKASDSLDAGASLGISVYGVSIGGEIEKAVTKLMTDGAISVEVKGEDANMDAIVTHVQEMATRLFFEPFEEPDAADEFGNLDAIGGAMASAGSSANRYFSINAKVKYKRKQFATTGSSRFSLKKQSPATRKWSIVFNAGEIATDLRDDPRHVRTEDLTSTTVAERRVAVQLDAGLEDIFDELVDLVTVEVRKIHAGERESFRQLTITKEQFLSDEDDANLVLSYPRFEGDAWENWLSYQTRSIWTLRGGAPFETAWRETRDAQIVLAAPVVRTAVHPLGDLAALKARGVRAVILEVNYDFLSDAKTTRKTALTSTEAFEPFELLVPRDGTEFRYTVTHIYPENRRESFTSSDRSGFVVIDQTAETMN